MQQPSSVVAGLAVLACAACGGVDAGDETADAGAGADAALVPDGGGGDADCLRPLACPSPDPDKFTVCGRLTDAQTGAFVVPAAGPTEANCNPAEPSADGACALSITLFDALEYATDPTGTTPLSVGDLAVDDCGYFAAADVPVPATQFGVLVIDDAAGAPDVVVQTAHMFPVAAGQHDPDEQLMVVRKASDTSWTTTAGDPFAGDSFATRGAHLAVFVHGGAGAPGVTITANNVAVAAADFYFSDTDGTLSTVASGQATTGASGAGLIVDTDLVNHGGTGGEPSDCEWVPQLSDSIPGVITVGTYRAVLSAGGPCP